MTQYWITLIHSLSLFVMTTFQEFDTRWDEVLLSMTKIPPDDVLEILYKLRTRESDQLKTVLELYGMGIHQKISVPNYQKLKTMVKARNETIETGAVVKSRKGLSGVEGGQGICYQWKAEGQCSRRDQCSFRHEGHERAKPTPKTALSSVPPTPTDKMRQKKKPQRQESVWEDPSTAVQKISWNVLAVDYFVTSGRMPHVSLKNEKNRFVNSAQSAHFRTGRLRNNQTKGRRRW